MASYTPFLECLTKQASETDDRMKAIASRYVTHYDFEDAFAKAEREQIIMAESETFLHYNIRERFTDE